jgi:phage/plasmid-like protein (TIGR03299 family)
MPAVVESMAYRYETSADIPWHGLGHQIVRSPGESVSVDEILERSGCDWKVVKDPLRTKNRNISIPGRCALVRETDGQFFDIVGTEWKPIQNRDAFEFFRKFCERGDMDMHTAGSLDGGRMVWAMAKLKSGFTLPGGDEIEGNLLFMNPHRFARSAVCEFTPIRVVCMNTLILALNNAVNGLKVNVSHKTEFNPTLVEEALGLSEQKMEKYQEAAQFLASKRVDRESMEQYFTSLFPVIRYNKSSANDNDIMTMEQLIGAGTTQSKNKRDISKNAERLLTVVETQPGADMSAGTWWQPFNAVTYLTDHEFGRGTDSRLTSAWFGNNRRLKVKALNLALEMAEAA